MSEDSLPTARDPSTTFYPWTRFRFEVNAVLYHGPDSRVASEWSGSDNHPAGHVHGMSSTRMHRVNM